MMDATYHYQSVIDAKDARIAELEGALRKGLDAVSVEKGWGTYQRMDAPEMYMEVDDFVRSANAALDRKE